ncbi:MAG: DivIVA domain-containing protein [Actinobacteria bacterium]|nr:DivIVA domain-containing protein [Actinomycetota bacterium]
MSVTEADSDLIQRPTSDSVRRRRFAHAKRGYDPDQVRDYLARVADEMERLEHEAFRARSDADSLARGTRTAREDAYSELASRVAEVLRAADTHAEAARRAAAEESERIVREAEDRARRIVAEGETRAAAMRGESESLLRRAQAEAESMLAGLAARRDAILADLQAMRERLVGVVRGLESTVASGESGDTGETREAELTAEPARREPARSLVPPEVEEAERAFLDAAAVGWDSAPGPDTLDLTLPPLDLSLEDEDEEEDDRGAEAPGRAEPPRLEADPGTA